MSHKTLSNFVRMEPSSFKPVVRLKKLQKSADVNAKDTPIMISIVSEKARKAREIKVRDPETLYEVYVTPSGTTTTSAAAQTSAALTSTEIEASRATTTTETSLARVRMTYACPDCSETFSFLQSLYNHSSDQHYQQKVWTGQIAQRSVQLVIQCIQLFFIHRLVIRLQSIFFRYSCSIDISSFSGPGMAFASSATSTPLPPCSPFLIISEPTTSW